jgi:ribonuclease HI
MSSKSICFSKELNMDIQLYSDGSATTADKCGGYAWVVVIDGKKYSESSGHMQRATNNDAELEAALQGLKEVHRLYINPPSSCAPGVFEQPKVTTVTLVSDSQLVLGWVSGKYTFRQQDKIDKYKELMIHVKLMDVQTRWVAGHTGQEHNERCDVLANAARLSGIPGLQILNPILTFDPSINEGKHSVIGKKKKDVMCIWYGNILKIIDLETNIVENHDAELHGPRTGVVALHRKEE